MKPVSIEVSYMQSPDSCDDSDLDQQITISTQDAGGGPYLVISTTRWAINLEDIADFVAAMTKLLDSVENNARH